MEHVGGSSGESVKVFVRVRPPDPNLESDSTLGHSVCLDVTSDSTLMVYSKPDPKVFTFDHVAGKDITQEDVFTSVGRPIIDSCMHGYNGTIFAYGQTGSGKTFTMIGPPSDDSEDTFTHELRGIIPRSFEYLFSFINRNKQKYGGLVEFLCKCSFLEIYNEQVFDLLDPASTGLHLRENMKHGVYVDGLTEISVSSAREAYQVLSTGWVNRKVASTSMNRESSRSHAVFTLSIESKKREAKDSVAKIRTSVLNLVDLAGSERQRDTHAAGLRLKEAGSINKSLSALGNVIMALVDIANGKSRHVHYRDSKLTFLLRDSLGGNAKTHLVANVHPSARCFGESLSTLNFARRAKMIQNKAVINEDASGNVLQLQAEIKRLRSLLEHYKSGSPTPSVMNGSMLSPPSPTPSDTRPGQSKTVLELKAMLAASMEARDRANIEKTELLDEMEHLKELNEKKDKFLLSTKMILKFRESHISNLEKVRKKDVPEGISLQDETNKMLREEIQQLKYLIEHHPDRTRLIHENEGLKVEIKKLRSTTGAKTDMTQQKQLARSHQYTLQLERQLRHYLAKGGVNGTSPVSNCLTSTPTKMTFEVEGLQTRIRQLQEELDTTRRTLHSDREEFHLRESKLEASLNASKKANAELQRSIEALKLKNSVEKATLNDIHMNTIKTILTPKREREQMVRNRSFSCSPSSVVRRADSAPSEPHPLVNRTSIDTTYELLSMSSPPVTSSNSKFPAILEKSEGSFLKKEPGSPISLPGDSVATILNFNSTPNRTPGSTPQAKKARLSRDPALSDSDAEETSSTGAITSKVSFSCSADLDEDEISDYKKETAKSMEDLIEDNEETELDESRIQGALTEELKRLQDRNHRLEQELEELERRVVNLTHAKGALEAQLEEVTQLSRVERDGYYEKERAYLEKVSSMASEIADLKSTNGVLESEVQDLRVCLKSADKELKEVRDEKREEKRSYDNKIANYMQKINELDRLHSMEETKYNRAVEELQNIQVETETLREEITFKEHRIGELEEALKKEKDQISAQEGEIQGLLEKLTHEVETNTRLSMELQEDHHGKEELVATVNENLKLKKEVEKLEGELQNHLQAQKRQMEEMELALNTLLKKKATDEAAIAGFVANIQELRNEKAVTECRLADLEKELEDSSKELGAALSKNDSLRSEIQEMEKRVEEKEDMCDRTVALKDAEREVVMDDLDRLNDQYQQLNMRFEDEVRKLEATQGELDEARRELMVSENEVKRLLHERIEKRSLVKDQDDTETTYDEEIKQLKWQLDQAANMIESYEQTREEKNNEIIKLKELVQSLEEAKEARDSQQGLIAELRYELDQRKQEEMSLRSQYQEAKTEVEEVREVSRQMDIEMKKISRENMNLQMKCGQLMEQVTALMEQIERYKSSEESLFQEKETVRSQLEMLHEEKAKLSKECEKLAKENAAITGHQNIRQKIQYHAAVKIENAKLKEEVIQLHTRLKRKADQVDKLQTILTEKGLEPYRSKNSKKMQLEQDQDQDFKENIRP